MTTDQERIRKKEMVEIGSMGNKVEKDVKA